MKKISLYLFSFFVASCFSLNAKDAIEESIAYLNVEKVREILAHNLLMKAEDKEKYLKQVQTLLIEIEKWENETTVFGPPLKCLQPLRQNSAAWGFISCMLSALCVGNCAILVNDIIKKGYGIHDREVIMLSLPAMGVLITAVMALAKFGKLSVSKLALSGYKRAYMIKGLLEKVPTAEIKN